LEARGVYHYAESIRRARERIERVRRGGVWAKANDYGRIQESARSATNAKQQGAIVYYLFFASQVEVAENIVKDIFRKYRNRGEN
jgi:hypothetical protein